MRTRGLVLKTIVVGVALAGALATFSLAQQPAEKSKGLTRPPPESRPMMDKAAKTLFDRLGGTYAVAAMVDDYIDNLVKDPTVMANLQTKASVEKAAGAHGVPGLKYQITAFVIEATGGPYKYHGRDMKETHKTLNITQAEWDASAVVFRNTMKKFNVAQKEQDDVFAVINTAHDDIVIGGKGMPAPMPKPSGH